MYISFIANSIGSLHKTTALGSGLSNFRIEKIIVSSGQSLVNENDDTDMKLRPVARHD